MFCWSERFVEMTRISHHKRVEAAARMRSSRAQYGLNGCIIWQRVLNPGCVVAWSHTHICIQTHRLKYTRIGSDALPLPGLIRRLHNRDRIDGMALRSPVHESKHVQEKRGRLCKDWCVIRVPVHTFYLYPSAELRLARVCTDAIFPASRWWGSDTHSTAARAVQTGSRPPRQTQAGTAEKKDLTKDPSARFDVRFSDIGTHECFLHIT